MKPLLVGKFFKTRNHARVHPLEAFYLPCIYFELGAAGWFRGIQGWDGPLGSSEAPIPYAQEVFLA